MHVCRVGLECRDGGRDGRGARVCCCWDSLPQGAGTATSGRDSPFLPLPPPAWPAPRSHVQALVAGCSAGVSLHARLEIAAWWPGPDPWLSPVACRFRSSPGCERALLASSTGTRPLQFLSRPLSPLRKKHHTTLLPSARATRIVQQRRPTAPRLPWPFFALSHTLCESSVKGLVEFAVTRVGACALPNERNELDDRMMPLGQSPAKHRLLQAQDPVSP